MTIEMLRQSAGDLRDKLWELDRSYGYEEKRRRLSQKLLRLVVSVYMPPRELEEALAIALDLNFPAAKTPGKLGYGRKERDKFIAAIRAEKRYLKKHGHPASAYAIAKEVSALAERNGLRGLSHNTVNVWRKDDQYQIFAFAPDLSE